MRRLLLVGRSEAGKTTLMQALSGEKIHYSKTQTVYQNDWIIDTPGEYAQTAEYEKAIALFAYEADVVALVISANEPYMLFSPCITQLVNREVVGVITGIDKPDARIELVESWLHLCGCRRIFHVCAFDGKGLLELKKYMKGDIN